MLIARPAMTRLRMRVCACVRVCVCGRLVCRCSALNCTGSHDLTVCVCVCVYTGECGYVCVCVRVIRGILLVGS